MPAVLHCIGDLRDTKQKRGRAARLFARKKLISGSNLISLQGRGFEERPRPAAFARAGKEQRGQTAARFNDALRYARQRDYRAGRPPSDWEKTKKPADRISGPRVLPLATMDVCR